MLWIKHNPICGIWGFIKGDCFQLNLPRSSPTALPQESERAGFGFTMSHLLLMSCSWEDTPVQFPFNTF